MGKPTELRLATNERHLATFEAVLAAFTNARVLALGSTTACRSAAGTVAATDTLATFCRTRCGTKAMKHMRGAILGVSYQRVNMKIAVKARILYNDSMSPVSKHTEISLLTLALVGVLTVGSTQLPASVSARPVPLPDSSVWLKIE